VPPLLQMLIFGYAASYEVNRVSTAVLDFDHSQESREFLDRFNASSRFQVRWFFRKPFFKSSRIRSKSALVRRLFHAGFFWNHG